MVGASVLAARSALHFGAGSVAVSSPRGDLVTAAAPELLTMSFEEAEERLDRFDVAIVGPGLDDSDRDAVIPILSKASRVLLDAGGLDPALLDAAAEGARRWWSHHAAEFQRVVGVGGGAFGQAYAHRKGVLVVLKGNPTLISDGTEPILVAPVVRSWPRSAPAMSWLE